MTSEVEGVLREEMDARGWHDDDRRAGLAAIVGGESEFVPKFETGYGHTANDRIRMIFGSRVNGLSDDQLTELKASDEKFFNWIYGAQFGVGRELGNIDAGDGFKYRGGGLNQLTGRGNYATYGPKVGVDLVANPELVNTPRVAAAVAVEYMKDRFHGGDFNAMKAAVGVSIGGPDEEKNRLYAQYKQSGEWNYTGVSTPVIQPPVPPVVVVKPIPPVVVVKPVPPVPTPGYLRSPVDRIKAIQAILQEDALYRGHIDGIWGDGSDAALNLLMDQAVAELAKE
jgi:predicted chitinase